jgi:hypothetical protein
MPRIADLPRRDWREQAAPFVDRLSAVLRTPEGRQTLRLAQAAGLLEGPTVGGLFMNGRVGIGKTLTLALMPRLIGAKRPLILTMGGIKRETANHIGKVCADWLAPVDILVESYTKISRMPARGETLESLWPDPNHPKGGWAPDFIGCDEVDRLGNPGAALTRVIGDWRDAYPEAFFMGVTGTADATGLCGYAHLVAWALGELSPLPITKDDIDAWHEVITKGDMRLSVQVCQDLGIPKNSNLDTIRAAYRSRLHSTPGVIVEDTPFAAVPLTIQSHLLDVGLEPQFQRLRQLGQKDDGLDVLPDAPDGAELEAEDAEPEIDRVAGGQISEVARQYGRGFFYKADPLPPAEWLAARRRYFGWVRAQIADGRFYTELQAREHAIRWGLRAWAEWQEIEPTFTLQYRTVWLSRAALDWAQAWGTAAPGLIWVERTAVGLELERQTGWTYYGGRGLSASGSYIEDAPKHKTAIASRSANSVGRNLQYHWNRMLFLQPCTKSSIFEQALGRMHREGIESWADHVHADVLVTCSEDFRAIGRTLSTARGTQQSFYSQKAAVCPWAHVDPPREMRWAFA